MFTARGSVIVQEVPANRESAGKFGAPMGFPPEGTSLLSSVPFRQAEPILDDRMGQLPRPTNPLGDKAPTDRRAIRDLCRCPESAIRRETRIKGWKRQWNLQLIEKFNPDWRDLHDEIDIEGTFVDEEC